MPKVNLNAKGHMQCKQEKTLNKKVKHRMKTPYKTLAIQNLSTNGLFTVLRDSTDLQSKDIKLVERLRLLGTTVIKGWGSDRLI